MKNKFLLIAFSLLMVLALAACSTGGVAQSVDKTQTPRTIVVTGSGRVTLTPDIAYINIGVHSQADKVTDALSQNNKVAQSVAKALSELGVDAKDIQTSAFNVYPQQEFNPQGEVTRNYYAVDNSIYVTVRDLGKLGEMLDTVIRSGANNINGITFDVENKDAALSQARKAAVESARKQAEELAAAAGVQLGELQNLNIYTSSAPSPVYEGKGGAMSAAVTPVSAGQLMIAVDANLTYAIK